MAVKKSNKKKSKKKNNKRTRKRKKKTYLEVKTLDSGIAKEVKVETEIIEIKNDTLISNNDVKVDKPNNSNLVKGLIAFFIVMVVVSLIVVFFPRIVLNGEEYVVINYNDSFVEPGYNGYIFNKDVTEDVITVNDINLGVLGDYEINYYIELLGMRVKKTRHIKVIDNVGPKIDVTEEVIQSCPNKEIPDIKYQAFDEYDGDLTDRVEKITDDDKIILNVSDSSKNTASLTIKVNRIDKEKPVIKLKGSSVMYITYGQTYKEPGYSVSDNCSENLTTKVKVSGSVGRDIGTYQVKYEVVDDSGNKASATRKVIIGTNVKDNGSVKNGTIYLTFDDGPNQGTTNKILDILKEEGVKATFFVTCKGPDSLIKRMYDEGHTIALHTASHNYKEIYSSVDNYFKDLNKVGDRVKKITGVESKIIRFPGGSSNTVSKNYSKGIMTELTNIVLNQGYRYFDWNVDARDASSARNSRDVYYNVTSNLSHNRANVVLMHDIKSITVGALRDIIRFGKEQGYTFSEINMDTYMVRHKVKN